MGGGLRERFAYALDRSNLRVRGRVVSVIMCRDRARFAEPRYNDK